MNETCNQTLKPSAQELRRDMTPEERRLWYDFLRSLSCPVKRQKVFDRYIADFYIPSAGLVIELDGSQHYMEEGLRCDEARDAFFQSRGITVVRYSNLDVNRNFTGVCEDILHRIECAEQKHTHIIHPRRKKPHSP